MDECDEFKSINQEIKKPSERFQKDFFSHTNNLSKKFNPDSRYGKDALEIIQDKIQKYSKHPESGEIVENPDC